MPLLLVQAEDRQRWSILATMIVVALAAMIVAGLNRLLFGDSRIGAGVLAGAAMVALALLLERRGRATAASALATVSIWVTLTVIAVFHNGTHDVAVLAYPGTLIFASMLVTRRQFMVLTAGTILAILAMGVAELAGVLDNGMRDHTNPVALAQMLVVVFGSAMVGKVLTGRMVDTALQMREARNELQRSNADLEAGARALRESEEKFARLFQMSPLALALFCRGSPAYVDVNDAWLRLFGYRREQVVGRSASDLNLWVDQRARGEVYHDADLHDDPMGPFVAELRTSDGTTRHCELTGSRVLALASGSYRIWAYGDVTETRRARREIEALNASLEDKVRRRTAELSDALERLRRAQRELVRSDKLVALGSVVAGVAHELNTPIGNALTVASTLDARTEVFAREARSGVVRRSTLDAYVDDSEHACRLIMRSLTQAAELVRSFKQVAVDQASENRRSFDLRQTIEEVLMTLQHLLRDGKVRVETRLAEGVTLDGYPGPLGQVINNLFTNALAHAFDGRERGTIVIETRRASASEVEIRFSDDGRGIAKDDVERIFDPFFTTKLGRGGSGLGLNIVHNIVCELLGGRIGAQSGPDAGTVFTITLPLKAPGTDPAPVAEPRPSAAGEPHFAA